MFFGTWNQAMLILQMTSSRVQPNKVSASAEYCCTMPFISHVITDVSSVKRSESARAIAYSRLVYFFGGASGRVFPMNPICCPSRNIGRTVRIAGNRAPSFFLEFAFLHGFTQEARDQDRHVLWDVKRGHAHLPDDLFGAPPEQVRGIRRILLDDSLHVARDHRRLRGERFSLLPGRVHASYAVG